MCLTDAAKAAGFIILDAACQRLCAGHSWAEAQKGKLNTWSIYPLEYATTEFFEFGRGEPIKSNYALYFAVEVDLERWLNRFEEFEEGAMDPRLPEGWNPACEQRFHDPLQEEEIEDYDWEGLEA